MFNYLNLQISEYQILNRKRQICSTFTHRSQNKFETSVQCKSTFSAVYTRARFFFATKYNISLISVLL